MSELLLQYTNLLHRYQNPDARELREFLSRYAADAVFSQRARKLNALFVLKSALLPATPSARTVKFRLVDGPRLAVAGEPAADTVRVVDAEEGYEALIYPAATKGLSTLQFEGEIPVGPLRLYAGETSIEVVKQPDEFGFAVVRSEDILPVKAGTTELRVEIG